ncbi:hypothetical protein GCM10009098_27000 [Rheinheimera aquimaris]|uniref:VCBS repeat-containing protein n=1 Tax=Rheinheimera aquimaris TaxID=412437 RepID=A0ABN1E2E6_9GAMM|nr:hypothetical protein [Rheinheimera aquimaris]MCB5214701.1 hypothetical protein [Rheinheimera aquimaris]
MEITSASQQFAVAEQKHLAYSRKQQLLSKNEQHPTRTNAPAKPAVAAVQPQQVVSGQAEDIAEAQDDEQVFNAFQTVGMVKRILAQLSKHTGDWLDKPLTAEFSAKDLNSFSFSSEITTQSIWLSSSQSQQNSEQQWLATEQWEFGYQAVQASFSGELTLKNGESISFALDFRMELSWARYSYTEQPVQDPLLVSLSGEPVQLSKDRSEFDLRNDGSNIQLPQLAARQYYLAYDRNQDQQVNNGTELFGPRTGQGFAELAGFDDNANGFIDPGDDIWQYLYLWRPEQSLLSMQQAKLGAISIESAATPMPLHNADNTLAGQLQRSGLAFMTDGKPALVQQIDLVV